MPDRTSAFADWSPLPSTSRLRMWEGGNGLGKSRTALPLVPVCLPLRVGSWLGCDQTLHQASGGQRLGRDSTSIPHDVDFCWDAIPSWSRGPNLHQGMTDVLRQWDFYPVLDSEMECGHWVQVILVQHLCVRCPGGSSLTKANPSLPQS